MKEIWKNISGYEELYQVSNFGRVKSLERLIKSSNGKEYTIPCKILKPGKTNHGHLFVNLYKDKKPKSRTIHQLVAVAFLNHVVDGYVKVIDHIDNDKNNNNVNNLQIVTQRQNLSKDKNLSKSSKYIGVTWHKGNKLWMSAIRINKSKKFLGYFKNEYDAHLKYQQELEKIKQY